MHLPIFPKIYFPKSQENIEPLQGYINVLGVTLDAKTDSDLDWHSRIEQAGGYIEKGFLIVWELDLGLFKSLRAQLSDSQQYLSLLLAIEHFKKTIIEKWPDRSFGVVLYRGPADFSLCVDERHSFLERIEEMPNPQNSSTLAYKLYCRDLCLDYIKLLVSHLPEELPVFLMLDSPETSPSAFYHLMSKDAYEHLTPILASPILFENPHSIQALGWNQFSPQGYISDKDQLEEVNAEESPEEPLENPKVGICLPSSLESAAFDRIVHQLSKQKIAFRVVSETYLNQQWDGLDHLIVITESLLSQTKRKLLGFCAAGGIVVSEGPPLGTPEELSTTHYFQI